MQSMLKDCLISRVENAAAAGTSDLDSDILDMTGFDAALFIAALGDVTSGSVTELQVFGNTVNSTSGATELTADETANTAGASDQDNKLLVVEVVRPAYRYVFARLKRGTQNAVVDGIFAIQHRARAKPVTQPSSVFDSALVGPGV